MTETPRLLSFLRERWSQIKDCERKAEDALHGQGDLKKHRALLLERTGLIASILEDAEAAAPGFFSQEAPPGAQSRLQDESAESLADFAGGARNALRLDSPFYMSALLYPDEHKKGEPDNLERLIAKLEAALKQKTGAGKEL